MITSATRASFLGNIVSTFGALLANHGLGFGEDLLALFFQRAWQVSAVQCRFRILHQGGLIHDMKQPQRRFLIASLITSVNARFAVWLPSIGTRILRYTRLASHSRFRQSGNGTELAAGIIDAGQSRDAVEKIDCDEHYYPRNRERYGGVQSCARDHGVSGIKLTAWTWSGETIQTEEASTKKAPWKKAR